MLNLIRLLCVGAMGGGVLLCGCRALAALTTTTAVSAVAVSRAALVGVSVFLAIARGCAVCRRRRICCGASVVAVAFLGAWASVVAAATATA